MIDVVYFSNVTGNTAKFVSKLDLQGGRKYRIPIKGDFEFCLLDPFVLITPTYGDPHKRGMVPHQVKKFLQDHENCRTLSGVIAGGNMNFGKEYGMAGDIIAHRFHTPLLYKFELAGTDQDVERVSEGLKKFGARTNYETLQPQI